MIVKSKTYRNIGATKRILEYLLNDRKRLFDKSGRSFVMTNCLKGQAIEEWVREFKHNETFRKHRRSNNVRLAMDILSFHRGDSKSISLKKLQDLTKQYAKLRGLDNTLYVAAPHFDKHHWHVHIISATVGYHTGKSTRISRAEFTQIKKDLQAYQLSRYPELSQSVVRHGRKRGRTVSDKEYRLKERTGKKTERERIADILKECQARARTPEAFLAEVKKAGLPVYIRGGKPYGISNGRRNFRFRTLGYDLTEWGKGRKEQRDRRVRSYSLEK